MNEKMKIITTVPQNLNNKVRSLELLCLLKLVHFMINSNEIIENQLNMNNNLNVNLAIKLFLMLLRRGCLNDKRLDIVLKSVNRLENISLNELNLIESTASMTNDGLDILLKKFSKNLKILILNSNNKKYYSNNFTDTFSLFKIAKYCSNLLHLELKNCSLIKDQGVEEICKECKLLERLNCAGCVYLSNISLVSASELENLKSINLSQTIINDTGMYEFLEKSNVKILEEAVFNSCQNLTKVSIESVLEKCENLKFFSFNNILNIEMEFNNFNRNSLKEIAWTFH
jgi:hypothetical protein